MQRNQASNLQSHYRHFHKIFNITSQQIRSNAKLSNPKNGSICFKDTKLVKKITTKPSVVGDVVLIESVVKLEPLSEDAARLNDSARPTMTCDICGTSVRSLQQMETHMNDQHHPRTGTPKETTKTRSKSQRQLQRQCESCGGTYANRHALRVHQRQHSGDRPFACDLCPKTYSSWYGLRIHKSIHAGECTMYCPVCAKGFYDRSTLTVHLRQHTGETPYLCHLCGKSTKQVGVS